MAVLSDAAGVLEESGLAEAAAVLERVRPEAKPGSLIGKWVPDPNGDQPLICVWVRSTDALARQR